MPVPLKKLLPVDSDPRSRRQLWSSLQPAWRRSCQVTARNAGRRKPGTTDEALITDEPAGQRAGWWRQSQRSPPQLPGGALGRAR